MAGGAGSVLKVFEFALAGFLLVFGGADLVEFVEGEGDGACFPEDGDFEETCVDCFGEVGDLFQLVLLALNNRRVERKLTRLFVCRISSGVFSNRR